MSRQAILNRAIIEVLEPRQLLNGVLKTASVGPQLPAAEEHEDASWHNPKTIQGTPIGSTSTTPFSETVGDMLARDSANTDIHPGDAEIIDPGAGEPEEEDGEDKIVPRDRGKARSYDGS